MEDDLSAVKIGRLQFVTKEEFYVGKRFRLVKQQFVELAAVDRVDCLFRE